MTGPDLTVNHSTDYRRRDGCCRTTAPSHTSGHISGPGVVGLTFYFLRNASLPSLLLCWRHHTAPGRRAATRSHTHTPRSPWLHTCTARVLHDRRSPDPQGHPAPGSVRAVLRTSACALGRVACCVDGSLLCKPADSHQTPCRTLLPLRPRISAETPD